MKNSQDISSILQKYNLRKTPLMKKVITLFIEKKEPLTAEQIHIRLKQKGNLSTIYRIIKRFTEKGLIKEINLSNDKKFYEISNRAHHHHLVCIKCNTIVDIPCANSFIKKIDLKKFKFKSIEGHSFELFGRCSICA